VHDVFTGGAEPVDLFTLEFLQSLGRVLKPNGVIAIVSLAGRPISTRGSKRSLIFRLVELRRRLHSTLSEDRHPDGSRGVPQLPVLSRASARRGKSGQDRP
jgi:hypothetical protein